MKHPARRYSFSTSRRPATCSGLSALAAFAPLPGLPFTATAVDSMALSILPGTVTTMASDLFSVADSLLVSHLDFDDADDGVFDDLDTFNAVFPQAPTLAKHHVLHPLVEALRTLIARPDHLFAALIGDRSTEDTSSLDLLALTKTAREYTLTFLHGRLGTDGWTQLLDAVQKKTPTVVWANPVLMQEVNEMMIKMVLHYVVLWDLLTVVAVDCVYRVDQMVDQLRDQWVRSTTTDQDAPTTEATQLFRPLRLRSQAQAADSTTTTSPRVKVEESASAAAYRRSRLTRKSNEFMVAWFLHHKSNPYPSAAERIQIAEKTGLSEQQVRNWFANMRKRHWKPRDEKTSKKPRCLLDMLLRKNDAVAATKSET